MKVMECSLPGVKVIETDCFNDERGRFLENYRLSLYKDIDINYNFVQDNIVHSKKNVLRGLHFQKMYPQGKLISVIEGEIFDVAVDINKNSRTYGNWVGENLSFDNHKQLFIPPGYAHGYCVLSDSASIMYKCTEYYFKNDQNGIIWNDSNINIDWPIVNPIISKKDSKLPTLLKS
mgnify:CR=1 FL=1